MTVGPAQAVLTLETIQTLAERLNLRLPATLAPEPIARGADEEARRRDSAAAELERVGLADREAPPEWLVQSLRLLCAGAVEFYAYIDTQELSYHLHTAARGGDAVLAIVRPDDGIAELRPIRAEALVHELLAHLPRCPPARGRSISAPEREVFTGNSGSGSVFEAAEARGDARRALELLSRPRSAAGQLFVGYRHDLTGRRSSRRMPLSFIDFDDGRWLTYRTPEGGADRYLVATSGSDQALGKKLDETLHRLRSSHC